MAAQRRVFSAFHDQDPSVCFPPAGRTKLLDVTPRPPPRRHESEVETPAVVPLTDDKLELIAFRKKDVSSVAEFTVALAFYLEWTTYWLN